MTQFNFSTEGVEPLQNNFDPLPPGRYSFVITETDVKPNSKGTGEYLLLVCDVTGPTSAGRKLFQRYNIRHDNPTAENIAKAELSALLGTLGKKAITDTDELLGAEFDADLKIEAARAGYEAQNRIIAYHSTNGAISAPAAQPAKPAASTKPAPPWAKKEAA